MGYTRKREMVDRRNIGDVMRWSGLRRSRTIRFDFEQNEEEDRAIAEAIAREEEIMRLEDDIKRGLNPGHQSEFTSSLWQNNDSLKSYSSNLAYAPRDSPDTRIIKHMLDTMIMQVCKWDKQHGWYKGGRTLKGRRVDVDPAISLRRSLTRNQELALSERMEIMKKEINKRRSCLESQAEKEMGVSAPWKKTRGRPNKLPSSLHYQSTSVPPSTLLHLPYPPMTLGWSSRASSSNSLSECCFLPHFASEDEDWKKFAYLLDSCGLPEVKGEEKKKNADEGRKGLDRGEEGTDEEDMHIVIVIQRDESMQREDKESNGDTEIKRENPIGRTEVGGLRVSARLQEKMENWKEKEEEERKRREREEKKREREKRKEKKEEERKRTEKRVFGGVENRRTVMKTRRADERRRVSSRTRVDPREISLGGSSPRKSESGNNRQSETEMVESKRVKIELPSEEEHSPCICGQPYDGRKVYLKCDKCSRSIHAVCAGMKESKAKKKTNWICMDCEGVKDEELYCLCNTPYDDTKFYVGCDWCEGWFHPSCVGITQEQAENAAQYICPNCKREHLRQTTVNAVDNESLQRSDYSLLSHVVASIGEEKIAYPYLYPVDTTVYPDYLNVVKQPIDLSTMQRKIDSLQYHTINEFEADFTRMIANARLYNAEGSEIWKNTIVLEALFASKMEDAKRAMRAKREKMRKQSECGTVDSCLDIDTDQLMDVDVDPAMFESLL